MAIRTYFLKKKDKSDERFVRVKFIQRYNNYLINLSLSSKILIVSDNDPLILTLYQKTGE